MRISDWSSDVCSSDLIFHLGVVDGALRGGAPGLFGRFIVGIEADDVEGGEVHEVEALRIADASAEYQVQFAHCRFPWRHAREEGRWRPLPALRRNGKRCSRAALWSKQDRKSTRLNS